ncbi:MAG TPA: hypothetical protein VK196_04675 [Magnetospirillum sp.]|nr:hypothetical protein [Magnetospirillum sp.]
MQDRDWTGTAAAIIALALTAGVWLWPEADRPGATTSVSASRQQVADDELARWRAEARRWDGTADTVQLSSAGAAEPSPPVLR